ncbi:MAG TPA: spherulation-specific family 4 protein [Candidatus Nitrosotalea sp.]|nr:spherulation-specific family 4 protein [Candidatus Nitrosotalea sp.]
MLENSTRTIAAIVTVLILLSTPMLSSLPHQAQATSSTGLMVPLYMDPGSYWTQLVQVKNAHPSVPIVAIVNPNNGPGSSQDSSYVTGIQQLQSAGIVVVGYVHTLYGSRSTATLETEMNDWHNWYHVTGIFFDEMANTAGYETYYSNLSNYASSHGMGFTIGNPGTDTIASYVSTMSNLCIYEDVGLPSMSALGGWHTSYPKSDFCMIAIGVGLPSQSYVTSASNYVGYIYATNDNLPNPYDTVPSYLGSLAADLDTGSSSTTAPSAPTGLSASAASTSQINLSWTAPSNNGGSAITGYEIDRSSGGSSTWSTAVANTGSSSTKFSDIGLTSGTVYSYRVSAINSVGTSSPSSTASATTLNGTGTGTGNGTGSGSGSGSGSGTTPSNGIVLSNVKSIRGTTSSNQITLANFNATAGPDSLLLVGVSANNNNVSTITFGGVPLTKKVASFYNNDAEFWYLKNPSGTADIVVTTAGATQIVAGAYSFAGVNQTNPLPTHLAKHNTALSSPSVSITTKYPNDVVVDLPSIWGGVTLGSHTCTQEWNHNIANAITGASSSTLASSPGTVTCSWTASSGDQWDDVALEIRADS